MKIVSHEQLLALLEYSQDTGLFKWRVDTKRAKQGELAGCLNNKGYLSITVLGKTYSSHSLAWFYVTGVWPIGQLDHINHIRTDNRFINLREATNQENQRSKRLSSLNKSGYKGVRITRNYRYMSRIFVDTKETHLGTFDSPIDAAKAYDKAALALFGNFALTNKDLGLIQ